MRSARDFVFFIFRIPLRRRRLEIFPFTRRLSKSSSVQRIWKRSLLRRVGCPEGHPAKGRPAGRRLPGPGSRMRRGPSNSAPLPRLFLGDRDYIGFSGRNHAPRASADPKKGAERCRPARISPSRIVWPLEDIARLRNWRAAGHALSKHVVKTDNRSTPPAPQLRAGGYVRAATDFEKGAGRSPCQRHFAEGDRAQILGPGSEGQILARARPAGRNQG